MSETIDLAQVRVAVLEATRELGDARMELSAVLEALEVRDRADKTMITASMRIALERVVDAQRKLLALGVE